MSRFAVLRAAVGSLITGLQTMPSIAWFPLAILLFKLTEEAIMFVVVLGAAPSIANGLIHGIDHIPPVLAARRPGAGRHGASPSTATSSCRPRCPSFVAGLKQGWAFAWRSLMAGELLVVIANKASLGQLLQVNRELADAQGLLATMLVILIIGIVLDAVVFGTLERRIREKRGPAVGRRVDGPGPARGRRQCGTERASATAQCEQGVGTSSRRGSGGRPDTTSAIDTALEHAPHADPRRQPDVAQGRRRTRERERLRAHARGRRRAAPRPPG